MDQIKPGSIVQITDESHHWWPALIVVSEVKPWGVQGYTVVVDNTEGPNGQAYIRLAEGRYELVGEAIIVAAEHTHDP